MNLYMHRIIDICVEMQVKYSKYILYYIYILPSSTNHGRYLLLCIGVKYWMKNANGWIIVCGWYWLVVVEKYPLVIEMNWKYLWKKNKHAACERIRCMNPHCQKPRGFKVERGAVLGTVPVLTNLSLCCRNFE